MRTPGATAVVGAVLSLLLLAGCGDGDPAATPAAGGDAATTVPGTTSTPSANPDAAAPSGDGTAGAVEDRGVVEVSTLAGDDCPQATADADFPDVVGATFTPVEGRAGSWEVAATLCSRYDTPARYADAWRVVTPGGDVLGTRELLHDHAGEQPFTRSLSGPLTVPRGVTTVVVEARDLANGWGGATLEVDLTGS